jgi:hypothetical protein
MTNLLPNETSFARCVSALSGTSIAAGSRDWAPEPQGLTRPLNHRVSAVWRQLNHNPPHLLINKLSLFSCALVPQDVRTVSKGLFELYKVAHRTMAPSRLNIPQQHPAPGEHPSDQPLFTTTGKIATTPTLRDHAWCSPHIAWATCAPHSRSTSPPVVIPVVVTLVPARANNAVIPAARGPLVAVGREHDIRAPGILCSSARVVHTILHSISSVGGVIWQASVVSQ